MSFQAALAIFMPDGNDWLVTLVTKAGRVANRRVTPSTISREQALRCALLSEGLKPHEIADADIRRVGDSSVQAIAESDPFTDLVRRLKSR